MLPFHFLLSFFFFFVSLVLIVPQHDCYLYAVMVGRVAVTTIVRALVMMSHTLSRRSLIIYLYLTFSFIQLFVFISMLFLYYCFLSSWFSIFILFPSFNIMELNSFRK